MSYTSTRNIYKNNSLEKKERKKKINKDVSIKRIKARLSQKRQFIERKKEFEESDSFRFASTVSGIQLLANPTVLTIPRAKLSVNFSDPVVYIIDSSSLARHSRSGGAMQRNYVTAINTSHNPTTDYTRRF